MATTTTPKPGTTRGECLARDYTARTGNYLDRTQYDTPGSIRGCRCRECARVRALYSRANPS